ncbi:MAG: cyclic nucleotide-binding domain-containing protein, partial [Alphaproteobacteria bacterium]|nr:cyclic nucleotide-binding domain-containing protein [Alphaproteobacteria bacterium]
MSRDSQVLPPEVVAKLFGEAKSVTLPRNRTLFRGGDRSDGCYQIVEGLVKVTILADHRERILAILGPRALVGELSMIDGAPRSAA